MTSINELNISEAKAKDFIKRHESTPPMPTYGGGMIYGTVALSSLYAVFTPGEWMPWDWALYGVAILISFIELHHQIVYRTRIARVKKDLLGLVDAITNKVPKL